MKTKILYTLAALALIAGAIMTSSFLIKSKPEPKKDNSTHNIMYVKAEQASIRETESEMMYRGRVTAFDVISLAAEVNGKIMQGDIRFKAGEDFNKGDILLHIYSEDIEATLKSGKSSFLQTLSQILPDLRVDYKDEYEKWTTFFHSVDPEKALPKLPKINTDKEKVFLASNNVLASYYSLQQQEINLKRYVIKAPFDGSFKTVSKEIGAIASPGSELATIIRSDKLEVVVPVFPSDLKWIEEGDQVKITDNSGEEQVATIARIAGFIVDQSVNIYLSYDAKKDSHFLEGGYVDVLFKGATVTGFEIPREALVDNKYVYELREDKLHKVPVTIERELDDSIIISSVDESKTIVTESLASINPNMEYKARQ